MSGANVAFVEDTLTERKPFTTFAHYKVGKSGYATLSVSVDNGHVEVGVSYCHPRDKLNKRLGRVLALRRRASTSAFGFEFERNDKRLSDQLRDEFENKIMKAGEMLAEFKLLDIPKDHKNDRLFAPAWAIYSLKRDLHRRAKQQNEIANLIH